MHVNRTIIVSTIIIMTAGLVNVLIIKNPAKQTTGHARTVTRVVVGGYVLAIVVSLIDLLGGPFAHVGGMMLMVAVATAFFAIYPVVGALISTQFPAGGNAPIGNTPPDQKRSA